MKARGNQLRCVIAGSQLTARLDVQVCTLWRVPRPGARELYHLRSFRRDVDSSSEKFHSDWSLLFHVAVDSPHDRSRLFGQFEAQRKISYCDDSVYHALSSRAKEMSRSKKYI